VYITEDDNIYIRHTKHCGKGDFEEKLIKEDSGSLINYSADDKLSMAVEELGKQIICLFESGPKEEITRDELAGKLEVNDYACSILR
jgi:hypothetical protein